MTLADKLKNYLAQVLGFNIMLSSVDIGILPFYIRKNFQLLSGMLCSRNVFFVLANDDIFDKQSVLDIANALHQVREKLLCEPVLVIANLSRRERLQLVRKHISFVVPGTQMYLAELGIDFSEHIKEMRVLKVEKLRPAAQSLLISQLFTGKFQNCSLTEIAQRMGYTPMSIMRAANELEKLKLCELNSMGNKKLISFPSDNTLLWKNARPHMKSPVKKRLSLLDDEGLSGLPLSGEYALSKYSNLSANRKCYAVDEEMLKSLEKDGQIVLADIAGDGIADLEIWTYRPIVDCKTVDPLSLELSLANSSDPRVKESMKAVDEIVKEKLQKSRK